MWGWFVDLSATIFDGVVEILKILAMAVLLVLLAGMGAVVFYLLFVIGALAGYAVTSGGTATGGTLIFACIALAGFIALTDKSNAKISEAADRVLDAVGFACVLLGFLWSSATATASTSIRLQLVLVTAIALFMGLRIRPYYVRWRVGRRAARS